MCLITNNGVYIADKDIVTYKILKFGRETSGPYDRPYIKYFIRSPYQTNHIITNRYLTTDMSESINKVGYYQNDYSFKGIIKKLFKNPYNKEKVIFIGLHSFQNLNDAINEECKYDEEFIVECIIPKGTKYVKGYAARINIHSKEITDRYKDIYHYASETLILGNIVSSNVRENISMTYSLIK